MSFALLTCLVSKADQKVPCFIFSGNAEKEHSIDLSKFNRITFGKNSMVISSSKDDNEQPIELSYSLYHHLKIGDAEPTVTLAESIALNHETATLKVGDVLELRATVIPENVADYTVTWTSSDESVATVDAEGNVTAVSVGQTDIIASCGVVEAVCAVTVVADKGSVEAVDVDSNTSIYVDTLSKLLYIKSQSASIFAVGIYDINGQLLLTSGLSGGDRMILESLAPGVYMAVASDGIINLNYKFILK